jgi:ribosomal 50S subunit-recycling heat shock protein
MVGLLDLADKVQSSKYKAQSTKYDSQPMRLDQFLKTSRVCSRRTLAQQLCDAGHVFLNGVPAKSAHPVKSGDEITIKFALKSREKRLVVRILSIPEHHQVSRKEASHLYEVVRETIEDE